MKRGGGVHGGTVPPLTAKNCQKFGKKRKKIRKKSVKKRKNWEGKGKIGKVLSLCPSWQIGLATLLTFYMFHVENSKLYLLNIDFRWHDDSGVTGRGAECPPETSDQEIFADLPGKKRQGKKGKWGNGEENSLFKMTKICFGSTKMEIFYREKAFTPGKKSGKMTLPPQKNFPVMPLPDNQ